MNHTRMLVDAGWDPWLVAISYVVAALASYAALDLAGRVASSGGGRATVFSVTWPPRFCGRDGHFLTSGSIQKGRPRAGQATLC